MWIWQQNQWPTFHWDQSQISPLLRETRFLQGKLYGSSQIVDSAQTTLDTILANIVYSSDIEGEHLNAEQIKVLNRMLDGDFRQGINNNQYKTVAGVSRATATRHLAQLSELGFLQTSAAGGRSVRYTLPALL